MYVLIEKYILDDIEQSWRTQRHKISKEVNGTVPLPLSSFPSLQQRWFWGCIWPVSAPSTTKATPAQLAALHSYYTAITHGFQSCHFPQEHTPATQTNAALPASHPPGPHQQRTGLRSKDLPARRE